MSETADLLEQLGQARDKYNTLVEQLKEFRSDFKGYTLLRCTLETEQMIEMMKEAYLPYLDKMINSNEI